MPTGRMTHIGGLSAINAYPHLPPPIPGIKTGSGNEGAILKPLTIAQPTAIPDYGTSGQAVFYARSGVTEVAKANFVAPTTQGHRAAIANRSTLSYEPNNSPSRSQFSEGYTIPLQIFAASNTWQLAGPNDSPGTRAKQPNQKFVSPFSSMPIPVRMPWDI